MLIVDDMRTIHKINLTWETTFFLMRFNDDDNNNCEL